MDPRHHHQALASTIGGIPGGRGRLSAVTIHPLPRVDINPLNPIASALHQRPLRGTGRLSVVRCTAGNVTFCPLSPPKELCAMARVHKGSQHKSAEQDQRYRSVTKAETQRCHRTGPRHAHRPRPCSSTALTAAVQCPRDLFAHYRLGSRVVRKTRPLPPMAPTIHWTRLPCLTCDTVPSANNGWRSLCWIVLKGGGPGHGVRAGRRPLRERCCVHVSSRAGPAPRPCVPSPCAHHVGTHHGFAPDAPPPPPQSLLPGLLREHGPCHVTRTVRYTHQDLNQLIPPPDTMPPLPPREVGRHLPCRWGALLHGTGTAWARRPIVRERPRDHLTTPHRRGGYVRRATTAASDSNRTSLV